MWPYFHILKLSMVFMVTILFLVAAILNIDNISFYIIRPKHILQNILNLIYQENAHNLNSALAQIINKFGTSLLINKH